MIRRSLLSAVLVLATTLAGIAYQPGTATAHQSGCHAAHSCPSDTGSYVCGDTGNYSQCPGMGGTAYVSTIDVGLGKTLTGSVTWAAAPTAATYQWARSGQPIVGATTTSYTVTSDDLGQALVLTSSGTDGRGQTATVSSTAVKVPALAGTAKLAQTKATLGTVLSAATTWNATVTESFQWNRAGVAIAGATASTYAVTVNDLGKPLTLSVVGTVGSASARATSGTITALATVSLKLTGPPAAVSVGKSVAIKGTAKSAAPVRGLKVTIKVWQKVGRTWRLRRTSTATATASGAFTLSLPIPRSGAGAWKVQVSLSPRAGYAPSSSAARSFSAG